MKRLASLLGRLGLLRPELDYPLIRVTLLINFWFFGGWQWAIALLLLLGFWNKTLGAAGAAAGAVTFIYTVTSIPFRPDAWAASSGGFPAMGGATPFLIKDVVLLAACLYLLKQDLLRMPDRTAAGNRLLRSDFEYPLLRAAMVLIFLMFGYGKWFEYAARLMVNFTTHGPLIFWMYPVLGLRGESDFLGASELLTASLFFAGFWNKKLGMVAALLSTFTFISTVTIIPFLPSERAFLLKDLVLLAVSLYLLRQDANRVNAAQAVVAAPRVPARQ